MTATPLPKTNRQPASIVVALAAACLFLAACGSGSDAPAQGPTVFPGVPTTAQRSTAAQATAQSASNACAAIRPFYWEIGDQNARLVSGSVEIFPGQTSYTASTPMAIASATKWLYGAYVVQKRNGALTATDIKHLTFRSGYTNFGLCLETQTVDECLNTLGNGLYTASTDGFFFYNGGHMQKHASLFGLGGMGNFALAAEMQTQLGTDVTFSFLQPQLAGGAASSANGYAVFLRKLLSGTLRLGTMLGSQAVCTNPNTCTQALSTPVPGTESWHYSLGHWVEDDPVSGDGAFSSAGAFGFYPWIDASRTYYGVLARAVLASDAGGDSARCGRLIRKAWATGNAQ